MLERRKSEHVIEARRCPGGARHIAPRVGNCRGGLLKSCRAEEHASIKTKMKTLSPVHFDRAGARYRPGMYGVLLAEGRDRREAVMAEAARQW